MEKQSENMIQKTQATYHIFVMRNLISNNFGFGFSAVSHRRRKKKNGNANVI